ncbi:2-dehydro-3-deoxyphosphooctonate aldolase (KDO 8-P synthase) [Prosthecobacter fusiformis]|uniref:3-deoxy-8-phosphooctulonate synthase n=1 Tax=Prosthecobacter fusiformis TaxID=48464 RepID=A0A4R7RR72_9BACT|nr:3-deoxy-8-phosphooctulonate synthase [Prosthecobacter fusiformis]TDU68064.1 2-dehydro-3-deoxyphosphooctonate aldolase (KDO 8-P synthase) [Prosthecobacter fusiformis]
MLPLPVVKVGSVPVDGTQPLFILGPCVIESEEFIWEVAERLGAIANSLRLKWVFKASYDKANRSAISSYRGLGVKDGCRILAEIGRKLGVPVTTDVHSPEEAKIAAEHIDLLQIPAFLSRQTDLILTAGETGRAVNVKKGQFMAPWDVKNIAEKLISTGCENFLFTERGTTFGYQNLVTDMRSLYWMRELGYRVIFDATHSVQRPGGLGTTTGGDGKLAPVLARAAVAAGCDGVFMETHPNPAKAFSDGPNQVPMSDIAMVVEKLRRIHTLVTEEA